MSIDAGMPGQQLLRHGAEGIRVLAKIVPRIVWAGMKGALWGGLVTALLGLLLAIAATLFWRWRAVEMPGWLVVANYCLPLLFGVAGAYASALRSALRTLAEEVIAGGFVRYIYAIVKPACASVARRASRRASPSVSSLGKELAAAVDEGFQRVSNEASASPSSWIDRLQATLAMHSERMLALAAVSTIARARTREEAADRLEASGVSHLEAILVDTIEGFFGLHVLLAYGACLLFAVAPYVIFVLAD